VDASVLYVDDGDVLTAGGGAAGIDLCLHLIRTLYGAEVTNRLARALAVPPHRPGGQAPYIESPMPELDSDDPVARSMAWALTQLDRVLPVTELARRAHMSRRNYDRRFREIIGVAPAAWLIHQRVLRARRMLESSELPIDEVAQSCGFSSAAALRPHFRRSVGVVPTAYREAFGTTAGPSDCRRNGESGVPTAGTPTRPALLSSRTPT
jgi:transcriptional regulator GlxA family with amidase domain